MGGVFPGAGAQVYYNEAGEPLGWDYPSYDPPEPPEPGDPGYDDRDYYMCELCNKRAPTTPCWSCSADICADCARDYDNAGCVECAGWEET